MISWMFLKEYAESFKIRSGKKKTEEPKKVEKTEEKKEEYKAIGDDSVKDAYKVQIKNSLG